MPDGPFRQASQLDLVPFSLAERCTKPRKLPLLSVFSSCDHGLHVNKSGGLTFPICVFMISAGQRHPGTGLIRTT